MKMYEIHFTLKFTKFMNLLIKSYEIINSSNRLSIFCNFFVHSIGISEYSEHRNLLGFSFNIIIKIDCKTDCSW